MKKLAFIVTATVLISGCAQMYAAMPYLPTAKAAYCAAANEETRDKIRARYDLPQVIYCPGDE